MERKIQLIWDFKGSVATQTAQHHQIHLQQYLQQQSYELQITGHTIITDMHAIAYLVVFEKDMLVFRDVLKPHRAQLY